MCERLLHHFSISLKLIEELCCKPLQIILEKTLDFNKNRFTEYVNSGPTLMNDGSISTKAMLEPTYPPEPQGLIWGRGL